MVIHYNNSSSPVPSLQIEVPRQTSWHAPQGSYSATIRSVKVIPRFGFNLSRIIFNVHVPGSNLDYLSKVDLRLDLTEGSDLWNLICTLINRKALQDSSGATFDLERLVGLECDISISHNTDHAEDYAFPLVLVTDVAGRGDLVEDDEPCPDTKDSASRIVRQAAISKNGALQSYTSPVQSSPEQSPDQLAGPNL